MKRNTNSNDRRDGEGRAGGRRDDARPAYNRDDRSGSDRPRSSTPREGGYDKPRNRSGGPDGPRKPYAGGSSDGPRKPYKPYMGGNSNGDAPRKPFERKPYTGGERKPYAGGDRNDGPRKPYGDKPQDRTGGPTGPRSFDRDRTDRPDTDRKPFDRDAGPREAGPRKPYAGGDRNDRPREGDRSTFERKPFNRDNREERPARSFDREERKPFDRDAPREPRNRTGEGAAFRPTEPRSFDRDAPREPRSFDRDERPTRPFDREAGLRKPFNRNDGPRDDSPRSSDRDERPTRPFERKPFDRDNREERPARPFDREERKPFDRNDSPQGNRDERPRNDDRREADGERPFERKPFVRNDRGDAPRVPRPRTTPDRRDDRDDGPRGDGPQAPRNAGPRSFDRRNDGPRDERGPRRDDRDDRPRSGNSDEGERHIERRTGHYKSAPNYNMDRMKENLPQSRKVARNLQRESDPNAIRLNRYIANAGVCSRREADELIAKGDVQVNGSVITEMGYRVKPGDVVKYGNKVLNPEKMVYLLLNKPKDYITTTEDPEERSTVMDLVSDAGPFRLYPVGRLDRNTTGLLLMTNDGELAGKLTHPSNNVKKVYQVEIDKPITDEHFEAIRAGLELEDGFIKPDDLAIVTPDAQVIGVEIHSGRNRIVRRMFESLGYEVTKLDRTVFAGLTKKELPRGKWRFLEAKEVVKLKYLS